MRRIAADSDYLGAGPARAPAVALYVVAWRIADGEPERVFTYAGAAEPRLIEAALEHVERLSTLPGEWHLAVVAAGLGAQLLGRLMHRLRELRRSGVHDHLVVIPACGAPATEPLARHRNPQAPALPLS